MQAVQTGRVRALAVTSEKRSLYFPTVPTMAESGVKGFSEVGSDLWFGIVGPAGIPKPALDKLNAALIQALRSPEIRQRMSAAGFEIWTSTPDEFVRARFERAGPRAMGATHASCVCAHLEHWFHCCALWHAKRTAFFLSLVPVCLVHCLFSHLDSFCGRSLAPKPIGMVSLVNHRHPHARGLFGRCLGGSQGRDGLWLVSPHRGPAASFDGHLAVV
jgi:hypothetical protein